MIRGTFANIRLRNQLAPGTEGGFTRDFTARRRGHHGLRGLARTTSPPAPRWSSCAGKEYGSGSSRDWAAKGTSLLGVKAVIAESYERIHRSNLIGMGVIPLQFPEGQNAESLGLTGEETFSITGITELNEGRTPKTVKVTARRRGVRRRRPHRHPRRGELLPQRRHHAVRPAQPAGPAPDPHAESAPVLPGQDAPTRRDFETPPFAGLGAWVGVRPLPEDPMTTLHDRLADLADDAPPGGPAPALGARPALRHRRAGAGTARSRSWWCGPWPGPGHAGLVGPGPAPAPADSPPALPSKIWSSRTSGARHRRRRSAGPDRRGQPARRGRGPRGGETQRSSWGVCDDRGVPLPRPARRRRRRARAPDGRHVADWHRGDRGAQHRADRTTVVGSRLRHHHRAHDRPRSRRADGSGLWSRPTSPCGDSRYSCSATPIGGLRRLPTRWRRCSGMSGPASPSRRARRRLWRPNLGSARSRP